MLDVPTELEAESRRDSSGIQVIARAAKILRALEGVEGGVGVTELARRVEMNMTTVYRIVGALKKEELLVPAGKRFTVKLGPAFTRLGNSAKVQVDVIAKPVMQALSMELNETVELSVLGQGAAIVIQQVSARHRLQAKSSIGENLPLTTSASGKAILACLNTAQRTRHLLLPERESYFDKAQFEDELLRIGQEKVAWDFEQHLPGLCSVATSFSDMHGCVYALSIPIPSARFREKLPFLAVPLLDTSTRLRALIRDALPSS